MQKIKNPWVSRVGRAISVLLEPKYLFVMNANTLFLLLFFTVAFFSCEKERIATSEDAVVTAFNETESVSDDFSTSTSIFDVRARSVSEANYVQEVHLVSFGNYEIAEDGFILSDMLYKDDGQDLDLISGDGLYTAVALRKYSKDVPFIQNVEVRSLLEKPIVAANFQYEGELKELLETNSLRNSDGAKTDITITCKIDIVPCPNEHWWDTSWFGEPCLEIKECKFTIT